MNIKTKIFAGFILGLMAIAFIGYEVQSQLSNLSSSFHQKNDHQNNIVAFNKILGRISEAESSVRSFSITNNLSDLEKFRNSRIYIDRQLAALQVRMGNDENFHRLFDNIDYKFYLMQRIVDLRQKNPSEDLLTEVISKISDLDNQVKEKEAPQGAMPSKTPPKNEVTINAKPLEEHKTEIS